MTDTVFKMEKKLKKRVCSLVKPSGSSETAKITKETPPKKRRIERLQRDRERIERANEELRTERETERRSVDLAAQNSPIGAAAEPQSDALREENDEVTPALKKSLIGATAELQSGASTKRAREQNDKEKKEQKRVRFTDDTHDHEAIPPRTMAEYKRNSPFYAPGAWADPLSKEFDSGTPALLLTTPTGTMRTLHGATARPSRCWVKRRKFVRLSRMK